MKSYFQVSVALSLVLSIIYLISINGPFPAASDGSGPSGKALMVYFLFIISCILLFHTFVLAAFVYSGNKSGTRIGLGILVLSAVLLFLPEIHSAIESETSRRKYNADPKNKTSKIIDVATLDEFFKQFNEIPESEKTRAYMNDLKIDLVRSGRIDILEELELKGFAAVEADKEKEWGDLVQLATISNQLSPEKRLKVYEWLFSRGEPFKFSLARYENDLLSPPNFVVAFGQVKNPTSQKMLDLLIHHGARFRGESPEDIILYCARFDHLEALKFLISQGVHPNYVDSDGSALDVAIANKNKPIIQELLKAGAKKSSELKK